MPRTKYKTFCESLKLFNNFLNEEAVRDSCEDFIPKQNWFELVDSALIVMDEGQVVRAVYDGTDLILQLSNGKEVHYNEVIFYSYIFSAQLTSMFYVLLSYIGQ